MKNFKKNILNILEKKKDICVVNNGSTKSQVKNIK